MYVRLCACMYVCMCVGIYVCVYLCMCVYTHTHTYRFVCMHVCMYICSTCECMFVCMYESMCANQNGYELYQKQSQSNMLTVWQLTKTASLLMRFIERLNILIMFLTTCICNA